MTETTGLPTLYGERVTIRPAEPEELDVLAGIMAVDPETSAWWSTNADTIRGWFADPEYVVLVIDEGDRTAGIIAFDEETDPDYHSVGIDISLFECCVGRGLGPEALRLLIGWLIDARAHHRITIDPAVANARAVRAYEKVGFRPIGVARDYERGPDGSWHDNLLMDLLGREFEATPAAHDASPEG
jgi:aminoglycoside 6'-N-acetyltransferase